MIKRELLLAGGQAARSRGCCREPAAARRARAVPARSASRSSRTAAPRNKDVLVTVEEAAATNVQLRRRRGGHASPDRTALGAGRRSGSTSRPRGFVDFGFRNIGGKNRSLDLYSRSRACTRKRPRPGPTSLTGFGFSEYRVVSTLREPRAIGLNADLAADRRDRAGDPVDLQLRAQGRERRDRAATVARACGPTRRYSFSTTRTFQSGPITPENQATDRPPVPAGPAVRLRRCDFARYA